MNPARNKRALVTVSIGDLYGELQKTSHPTLRRYADRIGAEFVVLDNQKISTTTPHWEKFRLHELLLKYDRILYMDTDLIVREDCPDLFEIVPEAKLGLLNEAPFTDGRSLNMYQSLMDYGVILKDWDGSYYNTGVMVISRRHRSIFEPPDMEIRRPVGADTMYEQGLLNVRIAQSDFPVHDLHYNYNRMSCFDRLTGEQRHSSYVIHYAGYPAPGQIPNIMQRDLRVWEEGAPNHSYPRHVVIDVTGGLGDCVAAEPAVRYFCNRMLSPTDDVHIVCNWPSLLRHMPFPVTTPEEVKYESDTQPLRLNTLPSPETMQWSIVSHLMCHTADYSAMALMHSTLPLEDRDIHLELTSKGEAEVTELIGDGPLDDLVLIHAGRHWESKTFPIEWWQEVVDGLAFAGVRICLIGKDEPDETRGVIDVIAPEGAIDLRNLLSLDGLISLIGRAGTLLSNDSAPIHIAGSFSNRIVLIPTCKHPDHIIPWRNGSQYSNAEALYKDLVIEDYDRGPWILYSTTAEDLVREWSDYLPAPDDVVRAISKTEVEDDG